jgi:hypothetical protein
MRGVQLLPFSEALRPRAARPTLRSWSWQWAGLAKGVADEIVLTHQSC